MAKKPKVGDDDCQEGKPPSQKNIKKELRKRTKKLPYIPPELVLPGRCGGCDLKMPHRGHLY
jgi:hypothetical protein